MLETWGEKEIFSRVSVGMEPRCYADRNGLFQSGDS